MSMKAGAFNQRDRKRDVQPGGRVLPGMFTSPRPSSAASSPSTPTPSPDSSGPILSSWGSGRPSGRLASAASVKEPSRLERLRSETREASTRTQSKQGEPSRLSRLGLNRASTQPARRDEMEEDGAQDDGWFSSFRQQPDPPASPPELLPSPSPPRREAPAAVLTPPPPSTEDIVVREDASDAPQTLFGSLWGRAAQLVGGTSPNGLVVKQVPEPDLSDVGAMEAAEAKVMPFELHEGEAEDRPPQKEEGAAPPPSPPHQKRQRLPPQQQQHRQQLAPAPQQRPDPHREQALLNALHSSLPPPSAIRPPHAPSPPSTQGVPRPSILSIPPVEPIAYHRPPPFYPRSAESSRTLRGQLGRSPYDWLDVQGWSELDAFLFPRALGRAPTRKGRQERAASRPMPASGMVGGAAAVLSSPQPTSNLPQHHFAPPHPPPPAHQRPPPLAYSRLPQPPPVPHLPMPPPSLAPPLSAPHLLASPVPPVPPTFFTAPPPSFAVARPQPSPLAPLAPVLAPAPPRPPPLPPALPPTLLPRPSPSHPLVSITVAAPAAPLGPPPQAFLPTPLQPHLSNAAASSPAACTRPAPPLAPMPPSLPPSLPSLPFSLPLVSPPARFISRSSLPPSSLPPTPPARGTILYPSHLAATETPLPTSPPLATAMSGGEQQHGFFEPPRSSPKAASTTDEGTFRALERSGYNSEAAAEGRTFSGNGTVAGGQTGTEGGAEASNSAAHPAPLPVSTPHLVIPSHSLLRVALETPLPSTPVPFSAPPTALPPIIASRSLALFLPSLDVALHPDAVLPAYETSTSSTPWSVEKESQPSSMANIPPVAPVSGDALDLSKSQAETAVLTRTQARLVKERSQAAAAATVVLSPTTAAGLVHPAGTVGAEEVDAERESQSVVEAEEQSVAELSTPVTSTPASQPLDLSWSLPTLTSTPAFDLDFGFSADAAPISPIRSEGGGSSLLAALGLEKVGDELGGEEIPFPTSEVGIDFGAEDEEDPLFEAFEATTSFVSSFAEAQIARAAKDPQHTERMERWLEQNGVERHSAEDVRMVSTAQVEKKVIESTPYGTFRPRTAPPASVAPDFSPSRFLPSSSITAASSPLPTPLPHPLSKAELRSLAMRSTVLTAEQNEDIAPPSPLDTAIGQFDVLSRPREVSRVEASGSEVQKGGSSAGLPSGSTSGEGVPGQRGEERRNSLLDGDGASDIAALISSW